MIVRDETPHDCAAIREINLAAFRDHPFSQQTEHLIVEALRDAGALELRWSQRVDGVVDAPKRIVFAVSWWRAGYPPNVRRASTEG